MKRNPLIMRTVSLTAFIAVTAAYLPTPAAAGTGCTLVGAQVYSTAVSTPTPGTLLQRGPIQYVADDDVDVAMILPICVDVGGVSVDGVSLPTGLDRPSYSILSDQNLPNCYPTGKLGGWQCDPATRHRVTVRLRLTNDGDGNSHAVQLVVRNLYNRTTARSSVSLVMVKAVGRVDLPGSPELAISLSEADLRNQLITAIWRLFGDDGRYDDNGEGRGGQVLYDPVYGKGLLTIESDGLGLAWQVTAEIDNWCDPRGTITGRFTLRPNGEDNGIDVVWLDGPMADPEFAWRCDLLGGFLQWLLSTILSSFIEADVAKMIQEQIDAAAGRLGCGGLDCLAFVSRIETLPGELRIVLDPVKLAPSGWATIDVPYHDLSGDSPAGRGFSLNAGDRVTVIAGGLALVCGTDASIPTAGCRYNLPGTAPTGSFNGVMAGPQGLLNAALPATIPVLDLTQADYGLYYPGDRLRAYDALDLVTRDPSLLPRSDDRVGTLLARFATSSTTSELRRVGLVSDAITVPSGGGWLGFGANERPDADGNSLASTYGGRGFRVTVVWFN